MPGNITDANVFTDPVNTPLDGESANGSSVLDALQDLANRTRFLKNQVDATNATAASGAVIRSQWAEYRMTGDPVAGSGEPTLTELSDPAAAYSLVADRIQVPAAGTYRVSAGFSAKSADTGASKRLRVLLRKNGLTTGDTTYSHFITRALNDVDAFAEGSMTGMFIITTPATERINVNFSNSTGNIALQVSGADQKFNWILIERTA